MAIMRPGSGIDGIQGTIGGASFLRRIVNSQVVQKVRQRRSATPAQQRSRAAFKSATLSWRTLSQAQRNAWDQYAVDLGDLLDPPETIRQSGFNLYVGQLALALRSGFAAAVIPGGFAGGRAASQALLFDVISAGTQLRCRFLRDTSHGFFVSARCSVYVTPPRPASRRAFRDDFAFVGSYAYNASGAPVGGFPIVFNLPNVVHPGQIFWARTRTVTSEGTYGQRIDWLVETVPPGFRLAWRMREFLQGGEQVSVERTTANKFVVTENAPDPLIQSVINMTAPASDTLGELRSAILATTFTETFDYDATIAAQPATNIPVFPIRSMPFSAQPVQILIPV